jgi:prepilin-type N-terminal cleavage/methylation domain-containing protein
VEARFAKEKEKPMKNIIRGTRKAIQGFTLIELLVVVAIIALLISILLPSLAKARSQARATVCASRLSQITKSMLLYAGDYDETPPFIGVGFKPCGADRSYANLGTNGVNNTELYFAQFEQWLIPNLAGSNSDALWLDPDWKQWDGTAKEARVQRGTLFPYARFANLYRCPDFERTGDARKTQNVFNYSRSILARKLLSNVAAVRDPGIDEVLAAGPIMKVSQFYNPAAMYMMIDEQWDFHCAGNYNDGGTNNISGTWMAAETIHGLAMDMFGSYHGTESNALNLAETLPSKKGSIGYYDGHVDLFQDPLPYRKATKNLIAVLFDYGPERLFKALDPIMLQIYAQRGVPLTMDSLVEIVGHLIS